MMVQGLWSVVLNILMVHSGHSQWYKNLVLMTMKLLQGELKFLGNSPPRQLLRELQQTEGGSLHQIQTSATLKLPSSHAYLHIAISLAAGPFCQNLFILCPSPSIPPEMLQPVKKMHIAGEAVLAAVALILQTFVKHSSQPIQVVHHLLPQMVSNVGCVKGSFHTDLLTALAELCEVETCLSLGFSHAAISFMLNAWTR